MDLELHQTVNAIVEIVKENYLVRVFIYLFSVFFFSAAEL